jgi:outer membrane protein assembly factor BamE (lipoprotein component of BamABCDE complex)
MRGSKLIVFICVLILAISCSERRTEITGIDWDAWKTDKNGCHQKREAARHDLEQQKDLLKSMSEMDVVNLMGRPDQTELYKRNQKFYTYFITGGPGCTQADSSSRKLIVRFNAMGLAKEVAIEP